ncbi:MAG: CAP domain-containing protein [Enhygromyxa sp.]
MRWGSITLCLALTLAACSDDEQGSNADGGDGGDEGGQNLDNPHDDAASYCVEVINMYRASIGVAPLQRWVEAETCSNDEAADDAMTGQPHGAFGACGESAQNECPGWPGPPEQLLDGCLAQMWAEGPGEDFSQHGHYLNMSNANFTMVACGFHETASGSWWAVQNFK